VISGAMTSIVDLRSDVGIKSTGDDLTGSIVIHYYASAVIGVVIVSNWLQQINHQFTNKNPVSRP